MVARRRPDVEEAVYYGQVKTATVDDGGKVQRSLHCSSTTPFAQVAAGIVGLLGRLGQKQDRTEDFSGLILELGPTKYFTGPGPFGPVLRGPRAGPKARSPRPG